MLAQAFREPARLEVSGQTQPRNVQPNRTLPSAYRSPSLPIRSSAEHAWPRRDVLVVKWPKAGK